MNVCIYTHTYIYNICLFIIYMFTSMDTTILSQDHTPLSFFYIIHVFTIFFLPDLCLQDKGLHLCYEPKCHLVVKSSAHLCLLFLEQEWTDLWLSPDFFCRAHLISLLPKPSNNETFVLHTVALLLQIVSEYILGQVHRGNIIIFCSYNFTTPSFRLKLYKGFNYLLCHWLQLFEKNSLLWISIFDLL